MIPVHTSFGPGSIRVAMVAAAVLALSACGADSSSPTTASQSPSATATATAPTSALGSTESASVADIAFAQMMIPHHQQAIDMAQMALDPASGASPSVQQMARQIEAAQAPEIALMEQWLVEWGVPYDADDADGWPGFRAEDHMDDDGMGNMMSNMMGMLSDEQMEELAAAKGTEFDRLWLEGMIEHHEGAVYMTEMMISESDNEEVQQFGEQIITSQLAEIAEMERMLEQVGEG